MGVEVGRKRLCGAVGLPQSQRMSKPLRLQQGQVWQKGQAFLRITRLERLAVEYKAGGSVNAKGGPLQMATKKEFCRLIKGASLVLSGDQPMAVSRPQ